MDLSYNDVFKQLAAEMGAEYVDGGFFGFPQARVKVGNWTVTLDLTQSGSGRSKPSLRIRAPFHTTQGFRFSAYHRGALSRPAGSLPDMVMGSQHLDGDFALKATDESCAQALLADPSVRQLVQSLSALDLLTITDKERKLGARLPPGVYILWFYTLKHAGGAGQIRDLFDLFCATLQRLVAIGAASPDKPAFEL
jgi:hypothetical protein